MAEPAPDSRRSEQISPTSASTFLKPLNPAKAAFSRASHSPPISVRDFDDTGRPGKRPRLASPVPLTAAAAFAEGVAASPQSPRTRTSPNPQFAVLSSLMGTSQNAMSRASTNSPGKVPNPATTMSEPMAVVAENIQQPTTAGSVTSTVPDDQALTSPVSVSSLGTLGSVAVPSGLTTTVGSPLPIEEAARQAASNAHVSSSSNDANKAFSYPQPFLQPQPPEGGRRGMSLPHSGLRQGTKSPSSKKHRCPYCSTEFTRHHNLKSHLLTHSQEKPYVCSTCQSRFRRLHDLKRHTKLHTGERPHICPKCGRKFARGDALARHNKGPGGCAGRRASMGSGFGDDGDFDGGDDSMDSVMYGEPGEMDDDEPERRASGIPTFKRQAPSGDDSTDDPERTSRIPSTYPPIQGRPPGGIASGTFPPRAGYQSSQVGPSSSPQAPPPAYHQQTNSGSFRPPGPGSAVFPQNPISESPTPLSPGQQHQRGSTADNSINRNRSPSMHQYHQSSSYPRPAGSSNLAVPPSGPQLPPPHTLNPPDPRFTLPSQGGPAHPPTQPSGPPTHMSGSGPLSSSHSSSHGSHPQSGHGSGDHHKAFPGNEDRLWAYVKSLETRMNSMQDEINILKQQLVTAQQGRPV